MSTGEPVAAFCAYRSAKEKTDAKKKTQKTAQQKKTTAKQNGAAKPKQAAKTATTANKKANLNKTKNSKNNGHITGAASAKKKTSNIKQSELGGEKKFTANSKDSKTNVQNSGAGASKNKTSNIKEANVTVLVEELLCDPSKKLSKTQLKKKKELEEYLIKELEKDDGENISQDDEFDSEMSEEEDDDGSTDSSEFSDEYTLSESGSCTDDQSYTSASDSSVNRNKNTPQNMKRKSMETTNTTDKPSSSKQNGNGAASDAKKSKYENDRKSLPNPKTATKSKADGEKRRNSVDHVMERKASITTACLKLEPLSPPRNIVKTNSIAEGKRSFQWLINPIKVDDFFGKYWENKVCLIRRQQKSYFLHLISFDTIDKMLIKNHVEFTKNIDITSYKNGIRETLNPEGRAMPPAVWDQYGQGCSIRLLNPQTFLPNLYSLSASMQEYFHCLVGANAYLTPPNSQGFAPHYDDIEAFVLQIEGRKRWKLYKPRKAAEVLPRFSSKNFDQKEIGKPILDEVLEPGDVLYFPRGTIHQASTEPGHHSLHITLSVYQKQSFADLFEKMMPLMLQKAIESNVELRRGLPLNVWQHAGIVYNDYDSKERHDFQSKVSNLMQKCIRDVPIMDIVDAAVDQCAKKFQHEALPPEIQPAERLRSVFGSNNGTNERGECICDYDINERTNVRLLRANIIRLVEEEGKIRIYYYLDNSKEYCQYDLNFIEIEAMEAASVEVLIKSYPSYVGVAQLPLPADEQKISLVTALWERGLLMMEKPFK